LDEIHSNPCPTCYFCAASGEPLYHGLKDRLFGAPGEWNLKKCSNPECGLVWLDPMPLKEEIFKAYRNYYTHQCEITPRHSWFRTFRAIKNRHTKKGYLSWKYGYCFDGLTAWTKLLAMCLYFEPNRRAYIDLGVLFQKCRPQGLLLDVGCGSGWILDEMAALGWFVEGVDPDPVAVDNAMKKGFKVRLGDLRTQNYPANYFDAVSLCHVIEHVHDPLELLEECHRILKPHGELVIVTPNITSWGHRLFKSCWLGLDPPRHLNLFTSPLLRNIAGRAGFKEINLWTSIRDAEQSFIASLSIQKSGRYRICKPNPLVTNLWGRFMYLAESIILKARPHWGEEIVAILSK
jgi:2-polyprenyl-3-methyl-5-hydroxy-6-metoxy-1,4-benzoquinol methylase